MISLFRRRHRRRLMKVYISAKETVFNGDCFGALLNFRGHKAFASHAPAVVPDGTRDRKMLWWQEYSEPRKT